MSKQELLQKFYANTRIIEEDKKKLKEFAIINIITSAFNIIKNKKNFMEIFVFPSLWKMLYSTIFVIVYSIFLFIAFFAFAFLAGSQIENGEIDNISGGFLVSILGTLSFFLIFIVLPYLLFMYNISLRQLNLFNQKDVAGIWKFNKDDFNFKKLTLKGFLGYIIIGLIQLPALIGGLYGIFYGAVNIFNFILENAENTDVEFQNAIPDFILNMGSNIGSGVFAIFVSLGLLIILPNIILGFAGLFEQLILFENMGVVDSIKKSIQISKKKYFQNALRWFLFGLIIGGVSSVSQIFTQFIAYFYNFIILAFEDNVVLIIISTIIYFIILIIIGLIIQIVVDAATYSLYYTAFYNFRISTFEEVSKEDLELNQSIQ